MEFKILVIINLLICMVD